MGCAPIYKKSDALCLRLTGDRQEIIPPKEVDIRQWLPGDAIIRYDT